VIPVAADLVIVDWSGMLHGTWHRVGAEGLRRVAAGERLELLRSPREGEEGFGPVRVVLATDSGLPGDREALAAHLDAPKRYAANREAERRARARDFWPIVEQLDSLVEALRIPTLPPADFQPQTWEADDAAATAVRLARAARLSVLLLSRDKDWRQSVTDASPPVQWWSQFDRKPSENVPGAEGIGPTAATALLRAWPSIDMLLAELPLSADAIAVMAAGLAKTRRERDKVKRISGDTSGVIADAHRQADELALWKAFARVHEHRADVELTWSGVRQWQGQWQTGGILVRARA
jgi:hypothetical protein